MFLETLRLQQLVEELTIQTEHVHPQVLLGVQQLQEHLQQILQQDLHHQEEVLVLYTDNLHEVARVLVFLEDHHLQTTEAILQVEVRLVQDQVQHLDHLQAVEALEVQDHQEEEEDVNFIHHQKIKHFI